MEHSQLVKGVRLCYANASRRCRPARHQMHSSLSAVPDGWKAQDDTSQLPQPPAQHDCHCGSGRRDASGGSNSSHTVSMMEEHELADALPELEQGLRNTKEAARETNHQAKGPSRRKRAAAAEVGRSVLVLDWPRPDML